MGGGGSKRGRGGVIEVSVTGDLCPKKGGLNVLDLVPREAWQAGFFFLSQATCSA